MYPEPDMSAVGKAQDQNRDSEGQKQEKDGTRTEKGHGYMKEFRDN